MLPVLLQLYSVRNELERDFAGTVAEVARMGYDGVELAGLHGQTAAAVKAALDAAGLPAVSAHVPYRDMMADPEGVLGGYAALGCRYIAIPYLGDEDRSSAPGYEEVKENIRMLCETARRHGMLMLYHNHDFEFELYKGKYALDDLYDSIPAELLQTEIDTCWVNVAGLSPAEYVTKYSGRAPIVHLKDFVMPGKKPAKLYALIGLEDEGAADGAAFEFRSLGAGAQDFPAILRASEAAGAAYVVVEQDEPSQGKTALQSARDSLDYLRSLPIPGPAQG